MSNLIEHEADISLLAEAATQAAEDLQTERFVGSRVVTRVNVHLDLFSGSGRQSLYSRPCLKLHVLSKLEVFSSTLVAHASVEKDPIQSHCTWLEEIAWLHWLDAKLPNTLKFFSSNRKPVTADFLPSSWLIKSKAAGRQVYLITVKLLNV